MTVSPKTERILLITSASAVLIILTAAVCFSLSGKNRIPQNYSDESSSGEISYTVGVYEGKLAIFESGTGTPLKVYDFYVSSLPEEDRRILTEGIHISSKEELRMYIEDYTS